MLEFVFARELDEHKLLAANFLGLAEIRIAVGDTAGGVELLQRLVVAVGNPFENLDAAAGLLEKTGHNAEAVEFLGELVQSAPWQPVYRLRLAKATIAAGKNTGSAQDVVASIASSQEAAYPVRTQAALALAGLHYQSERSPIQVGSNELNLLASGAGGLSAAAANQPFFYEARLQAAQGISEPPMKVQLLGNALADTPARDDARVPLFLAAASVHSDEFARGVIEPLLRQQFLNRAPSVSTTEDEIISSESDNGADENALGWLPAPLKLAPAQQAQVAWTLADVLTRIDRLNEAVPYLQIAHKLERVPTRRQQIGARSLMCASSYAAGSSMKLASRSCMKLWSKTAWCILSCHIRNCRSRRFPACRLPELRLSKR